MLHEPSYMTYEHVCENKNVSGNKNFKYIYARHKICTISMGEISYFFFYDCLQQKEIKIHIYL